MKTESKRPIQPPKIASYSKKKLKFMDLKPLPMDEHLEVRRLGLPGGTMNFLAKLASGRSEEDSDCC